jgi:hypothetical protein
MYVRVHHLLVLATECTNLISAIYTIIVLF